MSAYSASTLRRRFFAKVEPDPNGGCWLWSGTVNPKGYGMIAVRKGHSRACHRVVWEMERGPIPPDIMVLHRCDVRACVNPAHLWLGTNDDNMADMANKRRAGARPNKGSFRPKITATEALQIRRLRREGWTFQAIADHFDICKSLAHQVATGLAHKYAPEKALGLIPDIAAHLKAEERAAA